MFSGGLKAKETKSNLSVVTTTTSSEFGRRDTDPSAIDGLAVKFSAGSLGLFSVGQHDDSEPGVLATLDVDGDVALLDLETIEEVDDRALVGCPRKATELDTAVHVVLVHGVAAAHVLVVGVEVLEVSVVFNIQVVHEALTATKLLILLLLEAAFSVSKSLEKDGGLAHLLALLVHLELEAAFNRVVVSEKLVELLIGSPPGPVAETKCALLTTARSLAGPADLDSVASESLVVEGQCRLGRSCRCTLEQCHTTVDFAGLNTF